MQDSTRPLPSSQKRAAWSFWLVAMLLAAFAFAYFNTYIAVGYAEFPPIGGDVKNIIQIIQKYDDSTLFSRDFAYADEGYRLYVPAYIQVIRLIDRITNTNNYERSIQYLMFPTCFVFVLSMTWLLWRITKRRWVSLGMALVSTLAVEHIYGSLNYSVGVYVTPRFVHLAIAPLLFGLLLFYGKHRRWGPLIFLLTGFSSNLHFGSGVGLAFGLGLAWVFYDLLEKPTRQKLIHWGICAAAALLGALPYFLAFQSGQVPGNGEAAGIAPEAFNQLIRSRMALYPMDIFTVQLGWPDWAALVVKIYLYAYPLLVIVGLLLRQRGKRREGYFFLYFTGLLMTAIILADEQPGVIVALLLPATLLGLYDLRQGKETDRLRLMLVYTMPGFAFLGVIFSTLVIDTAQTFNLYIPSFYYDLGVSTKYFPLLLNIYTALFLAEMLPAIRVYLPQGKRWSAVRITSASRAILLMLIVLTLGYRFGKMPYNGYAHYRDNLRAVIQGQPVFSPSAVQVDYREATAWIRENTPHDALFLVLVQEPNHDFMFRYKAQRSMWVCAKDGGMSFYKGRDTFVRWYNEYAAREQAVTSQNPQAVLDYAASRDIDFIFIDRQNYAWLSDAEFDPVYENASYLVARVP